MSTIARWRVIDPYAMNGEQLPLLNGFPLRLIVPGWYSTYSVKCLNDIEVLGKPDDNFWMAKAYLIPDTPFASVKPRQTGVKLVPINRMIPRSFITNLKSGAQVPADAPLSLRGLAFGGTPASAKWIFPRTEASHGSRRNLERTRQSMDFAAGKHRLRRVAAIRM